MRGTRRTRSINSRGGSAIIRLFSLHILARLFSLLPVSITAHE